MSELVSNSFDPGESPNNQFKVKLALFIVIIGCAYSYIFADKLSNFAMVIITTLGLVSLFVLILIFATHKRR